MVQNQAFLETWNEPAPHGTNGEPIKRETSNLAEMQFQDKYYENIRISQYVIFKIRIISQIIMQRLKYRI